MGDKLYKYARLYYIMFIMRLKILLRHRLDFFLGSVSTILMQLASFGAVYIITHRASNLAGWDFNEIQLLYGVLLTSLGLNQMFADNLWVVTHFARTGKLESFLTRPIDPLFHMIAERFNHVGIGDFLTGTVLVSLALPQFPNLLHPAQLALIIITVVSGSFIFFSLNAITSIAGFWLIDAVTLTRMVYEFHHFARYPLNIFPPFISIILTWVIPYGLVSAQPISSLLDKGGTIPVLAVAACSLTLLLVSTRLWNFCLRFYNGSGS
jgi:ABC-2 type transport system permease protein